jgi:hypothetical protein
MDTHRGWTTAKSRNMGRVTYKNLPMEVTLLSVLLIGCYGAAPSKPALVPLPSLIPGAQIEVRSETTTAIENVSHSARSCPEDGSTCSIVRYTVPESVTRTTTTARYAGQPISYGQFLVMTDPNYGQKLSELEELSAHCRRANIPRYAGLASALGGYFVGELAVKGDTGRTILYGGAVVGAGLFTLGYLFFGGRDCNAANNLFHHVDMTYQLTEHVMEGDEYPEKMKSLADQFNAAHSGHARSMRMR